MISSQLFLVLALINPATPVADDGAKELAQSILDKGAELFAAKNAAQMAATYTEDAELTVTLKTAGETKVEYRRGRTEIENAYTAYFKDGGTIKPKNTVEYAKRIDNDTLLICAMFEPNSADPTIGKFPVMQIRVKQGEKWLISNLKLWINK